MWKWTEDFATIKVSPILSDDLCREVVLGIKAAFFMSLDSLDDDPRDGESLYIAHWKMHPEHKLKTYETFAGMTEEDEIKDRGEVPLSWSLPWHCDGTGFGVAPAKNAIDLCKWAYHLTGTIDVKWVPVVKDKTLQEIIKKKDGYDAKLASLIETLKVVWCCIDGYTWIRMHTYYYICGESGDSSFHLTGSQVKERLGWNRWKRRANHHWYTLYTCIFIIAETEIQYMHLYMTSRQKDFISHNGCIHD
jgi:hypothetical protein